MYKVISVFLILVVVSCTKKAKEEKTEIFDGIEVSISENELYQKYGFTKLSDYGFFKGELSQLNPSENVLPYTINSPLFSDYALKKRFIYLPEGGRIKPSPSDVLEFPSGTILIKNFFYEDSQLRDNRGRIIETRLLIRENNGWKALPYIWNQDQTEAYLEIIGGHTMVALNNQKEPIKYSIPTMTECKSCHENYGEIQPIGPSVRQLNKENYYNGEIKNQLIKMVEMGWILEADLPPTLEKLPDYNDSSSGSLEQRARAYLEINCAHCHREGGPAKNSGLDLTYHNQDFYSLGINKGPVAAGKGSGNLQHDIEKGKPEASILVYRMKSADPAVMMPELGRKTIHKEGVELISKWIKSLE